MIRHVIATLAVICVLVSATSAAGSEGPPKWKVASVNFDGNQAFELKQLKGLMVTQPSGFLRPGPFYQEVFEDDLRRLELFYMQNGYFQVKIGQPEVRRDSSSRKVHINIRISEGPLTHMEKVTVFGNTVFSEEVLLAEIGIAPGSPFRRKTIENAATALMTMYANEGYIDALVRPDIQTNAETNLAIVDFLVDEGSRFTIDDIQIETLFKTRPQVVERELSFGRGDVIRYSELLQSQRRLYVTGLFQGVFIRPRAPAAGSPDAKDIVIEIRERESIEFAASIGYGTVERGRGRIEVSNHNVGGTARKVGFATEASFIRRGAETSFTEPRTFGSRIRTDASVAYRYLTEPGYDLERKSGRVSFGRKLGEYTRGALSFSGAMDDLVRVRVAERPQDLNTNLRTLDLSLIYDTRGDLTNPTSGMYVEWTNELAGAILGGTDTFVRSVLLLKYYRRLGSSTTMASALEVGWMDPLSSSEEIPLGQRFYTGGPNSLRGFGYQLVGPLDAGRKPTGGAFKSVFNLVEIRQDIYKMVGGAVFMDIGNVWSEIGAFRLADYRVSPGAGVRINTPIGILRGDLGVNLDPRDGESRLKFYFNVGHAF